MAVTRRTVDLSAYPDLVVIYLGMRVNVWWGIRTAFGFGPQINASVEATPDGLLAHEYMFHSLFPPHVGFRQYWRDLDSLERWTRSEPHRTWWKNFLRDSGGTGFWHEMYLRRGGIEAIDDDVQRPIGMMRFAPVTQARGPMFSARTRAGHGAAANEAVVAERDLYSS